MSTKSILLVTVDCLRADRVGFMGNKVSTTPFLDSLSENSFVVPTAIVAGAPTYYSLPGILASRYPLALGRDVLGLGPEEPTLASVLKQAGYATAAFSAGNPYISSRFGYDRGFDAFCDFLTANEGPLTEENAGANGASWASRLNRKLQRMRPAMGPLSAVYDELYFQYCQRITAFPDSLDALRRFPAADVIVDDACKWLQSVEDTPFFLWLHLMDPHAPYYPKEAALEVMGLPRLKPYRARYLNSYWNRSDLRSARFKHHRDDVLALYDAGIRWVDEQMARLIQSLQRSNRWKDCVFALTADHGEEFLEHGGRYHPPSRLMEEVIHVPLLLRLPGGGKGEAAKAPFSLIHLAPTLLDAVGIPAPAGFHGRSCLQQLRDGQSFDGAAISECIAGCTNPFHPPNRMGSRLLSVRESRFKLVVQFDTATEHVYDLESDPGEISPLPPGEQKPVRGRLLQFVRDHLRSSIEQRNCRERLRARLREVRLEWARSFPRRSEQ